MIRKLLICFSFCFFLSCGFASNVDSLTTVLKSSAEDTIKVNVLNNLSKALEYSDAETSFKYINEALSLAEKLSFKKGAARANINRGNYFFHKSDYQEALNSYQKALAINKELKNRSGIASAYIGIGLVYTYLGDYPKAIENNFNGLRVKEALGDKQGQAVVLSNIGELYMYQTKYDEALIYHKKSLDIEKEIGNDQGVSDSYSNMAGIYCYQKKLNDAIEYYQLSLKISETLGNKDEVARALNNMGIVYQDMGKLDLAYDSFNRSLAIREKLGDKSGIANIYLAIGKTQIMTKELDKALISLGKAESIAKEIGRKNLLKEIYDSKSQAYENKKDFENGMKYHHLYSNIKDSLLNEENSKQLNDVAAKYDTEKKKKEIEMLTQKNRIQDLEINKKKIIIYSTIVGLLLLMFLALTIYKRYQLKQKANYALSKKNKDIEEQKAVIEFKNELLGVKNKEITDSIKYAKHIQLAILPPESQVKRLIPESFILYKPKDIVSGDFYWVEEWGNQILVAAADCTGHGVPGAFMSIVGSNLLQQAVFNYGLSKPFLILNNLNKNISNMLHQSEATSTVKDGMDIALLSINKLNNIIEYSGAYNPMWILRDRAIIEFAPNKHPVGAFIGEELKQFTNVEFESKPGDIIYIFTDGYADQFGGEYGKKFKYKNLKALLTSVSEKEMNEQKNILDKNIEDWKGNLEQVDDILIIGIKIS